MGLLREIRRRARLIAPQVVLGCLAVYFSYHAVQGERGALAWLRLEQELDQVRALKAQLAAQRNELERRVFLMRPDNLDPDMLEERARAVLNYGRPDEFVVLSPQAGD